MRKIPNIVPAKTDKWFSCPNCERIVPDFGGGKAFCLCKKDPIVMVSVDSKSPAVRREAVTIRFMERMKNEARQSL